MLHLLSCINRHRTLEKQIFQAVEKSDSIGWVHHPGYTQAVLTWRYSWAPSAPVSHLGSYTFELSLLYLFDCFCAQEMVCLGCGARSYRQQTFDDPSLLEVLRLPSWLQMVASWCVLDRRLAIFDALHAKKMRNLKIASPQLLINVTIVMWKFAQLIPQLSSSKL